MGKRAQSDFLFAQPSATSGVARLIDLCGTFDQYNESIDADALALSSDWYVLGDDLFEAIDQHPPSRLLEEVVK